MNFLFYYTHDINSYVTKKHQRAGNADVHKITLQANT